MKKNKKAQSGATGILAIPSGYAIKASPGPEKKMQCRYIRMK
jgi:hypothetical protein